jgi:hypothetical protein
MALSIVWEMQEETPAAVTYRFGESPEKPTGTVTIERETGRMTALEGPEDLGHRVVGWTNRERTRNGSWPTRGYIAS